MKNFDKVEDLFYLWGMEMKMPRAKRWTRWIWRLEMSNSNTEIGFYTSKNWHHHNRRGRFWPVDDVAKSTCKKSPPHGAGTWITKWKTLDQPSIVVFLNSCGASWLWSDPSTCFCLIYNGGTIEGHNWNRITNAQLEEI